MTPNVAAYYTSHDFFAPESCPAGCHDELLALRGRYAALWAVQTGEVAQAIEPDAALD